MTQNAKLYRMVTADHVCPFGIKAKDLLKREGFSVEDHPLTSREEADAFQQQHEVETTPQVFIDGQRIGGYDELRTHLNKPPEGPQGTTYTPVIAIFGVAFLMALCLVWGAESLSGAGDALFTFIALSMCLLAIQKLRDLTSFSNQFITYDLLARRYVRYAYVYPFAEVFVGLGMLAGFWAPLVAPVAFFIGFVGAVSVFKAVYLEQRELKCACVGGDSDVPLGFISLTENLFMMGAALWMWLR